MGKKIINKAVCLIPVVILYVLFLAMRPDVFGKFSTLSMVIMQAVCPCIMGWAVSLCFMAGLIDFSIGAEVYLMGVCAVLLSRSLGFAGLILGVIIAGLCSAVLKSILFNLSSASPMVMSIAIVYFYSSVTGFLANKRSLILSGDMLILGKPAAIAVIFLICLAAAYTINRYTVIGAQIRAFGGSSEIASANGIRPFATRTKTIFLSSGFSAVTALLMVSRGAGATPTNSLESITLVFSAIMAFFIAATFSANVDLSIGMIVGSVCFAILDVGLISIAMPSNLKGTVVGICLIILMTVTMYLNKKRADRVLREVCRIQRENRESNQSSDGYSTAAI